MKYTLIGCGRIAANHIKRDEQKNQGSFLRIIS